MKSYISRTTPSLPLFGFILLCVLICSSGCKEKIPSPQEEAAPLLFQKTAETIKRSADSIRRAPDSAAVDRVMGNLLVNLTHLNFDYPPNTDLEITEDENDSIVKLTDMILKLRDKRLVTLSRDSIKTDSLNIKNPSDVKS